MVLYHDGRNIRVMRLSLGITTSTPLRLAVECAVVAENSGYHGVWVEEDQNCGEVVSHLSIIAQHTERIRLATATIDPYKRNIADMAAAASGLEIVSGGRFLLGIGAGEATHEKESAGSHTERQVEVLKETVTILRRLFDGEEVTHQGVRARLKNFKLATPPENGISIFICSREPRTLSLAGRIADGVLLRGTQELLAGMMGTVDDAARDAGRSPKDVERVLWKGAVLAGGGGLKDVQGTMAGLCRGSAGTSAHDTRPEEPCITSSREILREELSKLEKMGFAEVVL